MALSDLVAEGLDRPLATIKRQAMSLAIAMVAAIAAILYAASALLILIEAAIGPAWARLTVALALIIVATVGYFAPRLMRAGARHQSASRESSSREPASRLESADLTRDQRIAMVFEALMMGFTMGSSKPLDRPSASTDAK